MNKIFTSSEYRYENKFYIDSLSKLEVNTIVKLHPSIFKEIFSKRFVNNIYYDSHTLENYRNNIEGQTNRLKVRIRWYGNLFGNIKNPTLEIKIKKGVLGKKVSIDLPNFFLDKKTDLLDLIHSNIKLFKSELVDFKSLYPVLLNQYSRQYFISSDKNFRITIDNKLLFINIFEHKNSFKKSFQISDSIILELKYNPDYQTQANNIVQSFPFRISKSSKYVTGIEKTFQSILY
tara:strand:+ start:3580 stop:4278 length:699 start_codon:yes stop_codon:yes gene_type:complete